METSALNNGTIFKPQKHLQDLSNKDIVDFCVSLFYNKAMWDVLITEGIMPFINQYKEIPSFFYFGEYRGACINLVLKVKEKDAIGVSKSLDKHFKNFFTNKPSKALLEKKNNESLFMDFENNSVQYGLFDDYSSSLLGFNIGLSELLVFVFREYQNEFHESINEIILQIITIFCNAIELSDDEILKTFKVLLKNEYQQYDTNTLTNIINLNEQDFADNKATLFEYLKMHRIIRDVNVYEELWEKEWHNLVRSFFSEIVSDSNEKKDMNIIYIAINRIMETFNVRNRISVYYLFTKGIEQYKDGK